MKRVANWTAALQAKIEASKAKPFVWGENDCFTFAADCVFAITGEDKMAKRRGKYKTELGANKMLKRVGGVEAAITSELGEPMAPAFAQRGDVVYFVGAMGETAGVCIGRMIASPTLTGVGFTSMQLAKKAWRV